MCEPYFSCNDIWGNEGGDDWTGADLGGNISLDPLFCDQTSEDFRLQADSPCWPGADCGLIGAIDADCDGQGVPDTGYPPAGYIPETVTLSQTLVGNMRDVVISRESIEF